MKTLSGKIVSTGMNKTVIVEIKSQKVNPLYKKITYRTKRYKAHSENPDLKIGDIVKITSCRPISKEKHYKVVEKKS